MVLSEDQVLLINAIYIFLSRRYAITVFAKNAYKNDTKYFFILCKKTTISKPKKNQPKKQRSGNNSTEERKSSNCTTCTNCYFLLNWLYSNNW